MRFVVRVLAVVGASSVLAVLALGVVFWTASVPAQDAAPPGPVETGAGSVPGPNGVVGADEQYVDSLRLEAAQVRTAEGDIRDVHADIAGLLAAGGKVDAASIAIDATIPFATVQQQVGMQTRLTHDGSGRVRAQTPITFLGRTVTAVAVADVVPAGRELLIRPVTIDVPGPDALDSALSGLARRALTLREEMPGLPAGMTISTLTVRDDGFRVHVRGSQVGLGR